MNAETEHLKTIAEEIAAEIDQNEDHFKAHRYLAMEAKRLEKSILCRLTNLENFTQRDTFHFNTLSKLVHICDILFYTRAITPNVLIILELFTTIKNVLPNETRPELKLPKAFVLQQRETIDQGWIRHREIMLKKEISNDLVDIAGIPFKRFLTGNYQLFWGDFIWLENYLAKLDMMDWENIDCHGPGEALLSLLIGRDFNDNRFYIYCKKYISGRTGRIIDKKQRLLAYAECEKLVLEDTQVGISSYDIRANSISGRLIKWIREEIDFVERYEKETPFAKLQFNLYVNRIAFFFKLLSEQKIFGDTTFRELAQQIASTCLSMDGEEIQAGTIISKAYPKDQKMLEEMEILLVKLLEYVRSFMRRK